MIQFLSFDSVSWARISPFSLSNFSSRKLTSGHCGGRHEGSVLVFWQLFFRLPSSLLGPGLEDTFGRTDDVADAVVHCAGCFVLLLLKTSQ